MKDRSALGAFTSPVFAIGLLLILFHFCFEINQSNMKRVLFFLSIVLTAHLSPAQNVGIGTATPNSKAILDINSTTRGVLVPSMTTTQRLAITSPPNGLLVYDTDKSEFYHFNATSWSPILNGDYWSRPVTNRKRISNLIDSVGIGLSSPSEWLDVDGNIRSRNNLMADNNIMADGIISGGSLVASGNLLTTGTGLINGSLTTNSDLIINNTGAMIQLKSAGENKGYFQLAGDNVRIGTNSGNSTGNLVIRMDGTDRIFVDEGGSIGIGVSNPTEKLDVSGNINFSGKVTSSQTGNAPLTPLCWGLTNSVLNGGIRRGTGNLSVTRINTGHYRITCPGITSTSVAILSAHAGGVSFGWGYWGPDEIDVYVFRADPNGTNGQLEYINQLFSFIIY
jgi:hypothetical protein